MPIGRGLPFQGEKVTGAFSPPVHLFVSGVYCVRVGVVAGAALRATHAGVRAGRTREAGLRSSSWSRMERMLGERCVIAGA